MANRLKVHSPPVSLRPATPEDVEFLLAVYASTRAVEMALVPWSEADKSTFVRMQFEAQDAHYRKVYPAARFDVVQLDGMAAGRLYVAQLAAEVRIIDIALLPEHRGRGVGTALIGDIIAEADANGLPVTLHVEAWNPAHRLYQRLGFRTKQVGDIYELMERPPGIS